MVDANDVLWSIDVAKASIHRIGSGTGLTDIAFNPTDHKLYGISFNALYAVSSSTANALVFDGTSKAYTAGYQTTELYSMNIKTTKVTPIGKTGSY